MATAGDVLSYIAEVYPEMDTSGSLALRLLQEAHNDLLRQIRLYPTETVDLTLVADTQEYTLDSTVLRAWAATYYYASASPQGLIETSYDQLDYENKLWRDAASGVPTRWYDVGSVVGLYPKPATATSGGYPKVTLYVSKEKTLSTGTTMPAMVPNYDAWIAAACAKWAMRNDQNQLVKWKQIARIEQESLAAYIMGRQARNHPNAHFGMPVPKGI